jgi:hypothetical protein
MKEQLILYFIHYHQKVTKKLFYMWKHFLTKNSAQISIILECVGMTKYYCLFYNCTVFQSQCCQLVYGKVKQKIRAHTTSSHKNWLFQSTDRWKYTGIRYISRGNSFSVDPQIQIIPAIQICNNHICLNPHYTNRDYLVL